MRIYVLVLFSLLLVGGAADARKHHGRQHKSKHRAAKVAKAKPGKSQSAAAARDRAYDQKGEQQLAELKSTGSIATPKEEPIPGLQER